MENNDTAEFSSPKVAIGPLGIAIAVWHQWDGTRYNLWASLYETNDIENEFDCLREA
jgi:hypothetical protein